MAQCVHPGSDDFAAAEFLLPTLGEFFHFFALSSLEPAGYAALALVIGQHLSYRDAIVDVAQQRLNAFDAFEPAIQPSAVQWREQFQRIAEFLRRDAERVQFFRSNFALRSGVATL